LTFEPKKERAVENVEIKKLKYLKTQRKPRFIPMAKRSQNFFLVLSDEFSIFIPEK
jgi:hypothetical protein